MSCPGRALAATFAMGYRAQHPSSASHREGLLSCGLLCAPSLGSLSLIKALPPADFLQYFFGSPVIPVAPTRYCGRLLIRQKNAVTRV